MNHTLTFMNRSLHTASYECNLGYVGYVIVNMPIEDYKELGCPRELVFSLTPVGVPEQTEAVVS